jgi:hypothetical protein
MFRRKRAWLPLGIDIGVDQISVVAVEATRSGCIVKATASEPIPALTDAALDLGTATLLRSLHRTLNVAERRCILGVSPEDVVTREFRLPPKMRRSEAERAAILEADAAACWPSHDRLIALDPIPSNAASMLLSIARSSAVERLVRIAKSADLNPIAVDAPLCAWRRVAGDYDALIDLRSGRPVLYLFGKAVGSMDLFASTLSEDRLAAQVRAAFVQSRRDGLADIQKIAVHGEASQCAALEAQLGADGYEINLLTLGESVGPSWALAYGLASWSILGEQVRAA